jgi:probable addiction module antidote protein
MAEIVADYDPAEDLDSPEAISVFVNEALKCEDTAYIIHALGVVARAKGMDWMLREPGLSGELEPTLKSTLAVMKALEISLTAEVAGR